MSFRHIFRRSNAILRRGLSFEGSSPSSPDDDIGLTPQALRQLDRLGLTASRYLPGSAVGARPSLRRKPAFDFHEHRMYVPGDDIRFVDWNASARQEQIFIRQGEYPKEATVYVLLDCSKSMSWGEPSKQVAAKELAAALGYVALSRNDRLLIQTLGHQSTQFLGPINGKGQVPTLLKFLRRISFEGQIELAEEVRQFTRRRHGGQVLIISDLLDIGDLNSSLELLPAPTWDVIVLHLLHPYEIEPEMRGDFEIVDVESGNKANYDIDSKALRIYRQRMNQWMSDLDLACVDHSAFYSQIPSQWSLSKEVIPHLRTVHVLTPQ
jgi:uncharacterized protein (DUF58 family)